MHDFNRRSLLKALAVLPFAPNVAKAEQQPALHPVKAGDDRTGRPLKALSANSHLDFKVLTRETDGALFVIENRNMARGGPPRHVHYLQEEWFYFLEGSDEV